jgi:hypothetical protein
MSSGGREPTPAETDRTSNGSERCMSGQDDRGQQDQELVADQQAPEPAEHDRHQQ